MPTDTPALGRHLIVDLDACAPSSIASVAGVEEAMLRAARRAGATIVGYQFHQFEPQGVSGVVLIAESHLSIHTWPERGYAAVDIFSCGKSMRPELAIEALVQAFSCRSCHTTELARGHRSGGGD